MLAAALSVPALAQQPGTASAFTGTWFGSFNVTNPDGTLDRSTAVLVLRNDAGALSGSMGRTIDQQTPITGITTTADDLRFHMDAAGGLDFNLKLTGGRLIGASKGRLNAAIDVRPAPGLLPHDQLAQEITDADHRLFAAFTSCNIDAYAAFLDPGIEFYHDKTGETGYQDQLTSLRQRCHEGLAIRRELIPDSLIINAAPGFGAIEAGTHRFYARQKDGTERIDATARFTEVWSKASGSWKLVRIISYDHE